MRELRNWRSVRLATLSVASALLWLPAVVVRAQGVFQCPPDGLVAKGKNSHGDYTKTFKGADTKDPTVCISVSDGPGAGNMAGKTVRNLYNWYPIDSQNFGMTSDTEKKARAVLGAILLGQTSEASFEMTNNRPNTSNVWSGTENWKRTGQTSLTVGGRPVNVITFRESFKGGASSNYDGYWDLWYDPVLHIFLKGEQHDASSGRSYFSVVESVSAP